MSTARSRELQRLSATRDIMIGMAFRTCWHCGDQTHMREIKNSAGAVVLGREHESGQWVTSLIYILCICDSCDYPSMATDSLVTQYSPDVEEINKHFEVRNHPVVWYPVGGEDREFEDVPPHIASAASEAYRCHSVGAFRATCSIARAVIEATAKDKGITNGQVFNKIEEMQKQNLIRPHIKDAAHEVRHLGNSVAHGDFIDLVQPEEAAEVLGLMEEVLIEVYQSPAKIAKRQAARLAKKAAATPSTAGTP